MRQYIFKSTNICYIAIICNITIRFNIYLICQVGKKKNHVKTNVCDLTTLSVAYMSSKLPQHKKGTGGIILV